MKVKFWCGKGSHWWGVDVGMDTEALPCEPPAELLAVNTGDERDCPEHDPERPRSIEYTYQVVITEPASILGRERYLEEYLADKMRALTRQVSVGHLLTREVTK